jgi:hypothetical protein
MQNKTHDKPAGQTEPPLQAEPPAPVSAAETVAGAQGGWSAVRGSLLRRAGTCRKFAAELMHEHEFWVHALAIKGGASAIVVSAVLAVSYVVAAPFMLAAAGIAACGAAVGLGIYGIAAGGMRSWYRLRKIYSKATGRPLPPRPETPAPNWLQRQCEKPAIKKVLETKAAKAVLGSRLWRMSRRIAVGQQDNLLGGLAVGGAVLSLALGAAALATQILVLPVIAVGGIVVGGAVLATSYVVSGISGLYFGIVGIKHMREKKRAKAAALAATQAQGASSSPMPAAEAAMPVPVAANDAFGKAAQKDAAPPAAAQEAAPARKNLSGPKV